MQGAFFVFKLFWQVILTPLIYLGIVAIIILYFEEKS